MGLFIPFLIAAGASVLAFGASGCGGGEIDVKEGGEKNPPDAKPPSEETSWKRYGRIADPDGCYSRIQVNKYLQSLTSFNFGVALHRVLKTDGSGASLSVENAKDMVKGWNQNTQAAGFHFQLKEIREIRDSSIYLEKQNIEKMTPEEMQDLLKHQDEVFFKNAVKGAINIYYGHFLGGYAGQTEIMGAIQGGVIRLNHDGLLGDPNSQIIPSALLFSEVITHEGGHYFGLRHTFEAGPWLTSEQQQQIKTDFENGIGIIISAEFEAKDGSNCAVASDFTCDLPFDPGNKYCSVSHETCETIECTDPNRQPYDLSENVIRNFMSYYPPGCKDEFSDEQIAIMKCFAEQAIQEGALIPEEPSTSEDFPYPTMAVGCEGTTETSLQKAAEWAMSDPWANGKAVIEICAGTYLETIKIDSVLKKNLDLTFKAREGHKVILSSADAQPVFKVLSSLPWYTDPNSSQKVSFQDITFEGGGIQTAFLKETNLKNVLIREVNGTALHVIGGVIMMGGGIIDAESEKSVYLSSGKNMFESVEFSGKNVDEMIHFTSHPALGAGLLTLIHSSPKETIQKFIVLQSPPSPSYASSDLSDPSYCYTEGPPECVSEPREN